MLTRIALALAAITTVPLVPSPAFAALPSSDETMRVPCPRPADGEARIWLRYRKDRPAKFAVDNPCDRFLGFPSSGTYYNGAPRDEVLVAPGTHFHWSSKRLKMHEGTYTVPRLSSLDDLHWHSGTCKAPTSVRVIWDYRTVDNGDPDC